MTYITDMIATTRCACETSCILHACVDSPSENHAARSLQVVNPIPEPFSIEQETDLERKAGARFCTAALAALIHSQLLGCCVL